MTVAHWLPLVVQFACNRVYRGFVSMGRRESALSANLLEAIEAARSRRFHADLLLAPLRTSGFDSDGLRGPSELFSIILPLPLPSC